MKVSQSTLYDEMSIIAEFLQKGQIESAHEQFAR